MTRCGYEYESLKLEIDGEQNGQQTRFMVTMALEGRNRMNNNNGGYGFGRKKQNEQQTAFALAMTLGKRSYGV